METTSTIWWAYRIGRPLSTVVRRTSSSVVRRRPHSLNIFSSETTGPIKVKFHLELLWDGGTKVCSNGPGHMTKMAAMAIYGKNLKKSSSPEPKGPWILVCIIGCLSTTKFAQMMTLGWPWHILRQGLIWSLMLLYGKKVKQWIFQKLLSAMIWNWQQMTEVTRSFCWHQHFVPWWGCMLLPWGYIHVLNHGKKMYKIRLQRDFFETCNKWVKW